MTDRQDIIQNAFARHLAVTEASFKKILSDAQYGAELLLGVVKAKKKILACGNGGSAMDAIHFAGSECLGKYKNDRPPISAISLSSDVGALTTISNDYGYEFVSAGRLKRWERRGIYWLRFRRAASRRMCFLQLK